jgi:aminoglycoside phosphotransferase (APT) family kinase protein
MAALPSAHPRSKIYYWKCDRPAAFHGTEARKEHPGIEVQLLGELQQHFPGKPIHIRRGGGQGNHLTFIASIAGRELFVRVEDGPEHDDYMEVESRVLAEVGHRSVPAPCVHHVDASRQRVPFAWQVMDLVSAPDLNELHQNARLSIRHVALVIGVCIARWQSIQPDGFGPFDPETLRLENCLAGFHSTYRDYFHLHLDRHLRFLVERSFLGEREAGEIADEIARHDDLLDLSRGCLVHKDLAFWNVLGTEREIAAFIDWDDSISGDPMDDLSLLGCFHSGEVLGRVLDGYRTIRPLPGEHGRRFWLHLLRNMIVKAVIRVGAGYFERDAAFYLIGAGSSGAELKDFTRARITAALAGLRENRTIESL